MPDDPVLIAEDVAAVDPHPNPKCDHICLKDDSHVERGEPHFYGYEMPSPRLHNDLVTLPDGAYFFHEEGWTVTRDIKGRGWKIARNGGSECAE